MEKEEVEKEEVEKEEGEEEEVVVAAAAVAVVVAAMAAVMALVFIAVVVVVVYGVAWRGMQSGSATELLTKLRIARGPIAITQQSHSNHIPITYQVADREGSLALHPSVPQMLRKRRNYHRQPPGFGYGFACQKKTQTHVKQRPRCLSNCEVETGWGSDLTTYSWSACASTCCLARRLHRSAYRRCSGGAALPRRGRGVV